MSDEFLDLLRRNEDLQQSWKDNCLGEDFIPPPNEHRKFRIDLYGRHYTSEQKLEFALSRPDIDAVAVPWSMNDTSEEIRGLFQQLMAQERDWEVLFEKKPIKQYLEGIPFLKTARYLRLEVFDVRMLQTLRTFPHLKELDLSRAPLTLNDMYELFSQNEPLAEKTPHVWLRCPLDEQIHFPPAAHQHLQGLTCSLNCMRHELTQLENLRYLRVLISEVPYPYALHETYSKAFQTLATWIGSSSCRLTNLQLQQNGDPPYDVEFAMKLLEIMGPAIGRNRSIRVFCFDGLFDHLYHITYLLRHISKSSINTLVVSMGICTGDSLQVALLEWLLATRPIRLLTVRQSCGPNTSRQVTSFVSRAHQRWQAWQSNNLGSQSVQGISGIAEVPRRLWAAELGLLGGESKNPEFRKVSLDAMLFLLQLWLSTIADIPFSSQTLRDTTVDGQDMPRISDHNQ